MKKIAIALTLTAALVSSAGLRAHDRYRIVGTVTQIASDLITVKQVKDNALVEIDLDQNTKVTRNGKALKLAEVKVGGSVVIEALGDSILDLVALEIRLVPAIPGTKKPRNF
jgi:hypothetical protein